MPVPLPVNATALDTAADRERGDGAHEVAPDIAYLRLAIVNVVFLGPSGAGDRGWVLVDAGLPGTKGMITRAAEARFGAGARPAAILLTHGHFDHVGVLEELAEEWDVPVFAHVLEHPYLDGTAAYPPPDPDVGGGLMSTLSPLFPRSPSASAHGCARSAWMLACLSCRRGGGSSRRATALAMSHSGVMPIAR
jgi:hypothetical protein